MRTVLPVSLASTKEAGSQTSSENELISDCWKLYPCASVAAGVKWGFAFVVALEGPVHCRKDNQSWEEEAIGVNKHGQESFHGECVGESSPLNIKVEPGKDQWGDSFYVEWIKLVTVYPKRWDGQFGCTFCYGRMMAENEMKERYRRYKDYEIQLYWWERKVRNQLGLGEFCIQIWMCILGSNRSRIFKRN